jgi:transcriptional regulator with XRE-family HTH domain
MVTIPKKLCYSQGVNYRELLNSELVRRKKRNPLYSLRSFARDLGISPAALSQSLSYKRELSKTNLSKVVDRLAVAPKDAKNFLETRKKKSNPLGDDQFRLLLDDQFKLISDWYYIAILTLAETRSASSDPIKLAKHFGILPR